MAKGMKDLLEEARRHIREVGAPEAAELLRTTPDLLVLDVREPDEFSTGCLPGAVLVPRGLLEPKAAPDSPARDALFEDPERPILAYCGSGARSALAAHTLQELGFREVHSLAGGIQAWRDAGFRLEAGGR